MSNRAKFLAAPKADRLDRCCPVKRPSCIVPEIFLPGWNTLPLFSKIPAKSDPENPVVFTRPKLGKTLYRIFKKKDFDTHTTLDLPLEYNCLHDPHLERHYRIKPRNYIHLVKKNYITPYKDGVICTQAQFNHYRDYLRHLITQQELLRRKEEEKQIEDERERYHAENFWRRQNRAWEWVKRAVINSRKKMEIPNVLIPPRLRFSDGEEDETIVAKQDELQAIKKNIEDKRMRLSEEHTQKMFDLIITKEHRKIDVVNRKRSKKTAEWYRLERDQLVQMEDIENIRDKYRENMKRRIQEREDKFERIRRRNSLRIEAMRERKRKSQAEKYIRRPDATSLAYNLMPIHEDNNLDDVALLDKDNETDNDVPRGINNVD